MSSFIKGVYSSLDDFCLHVCYERLQTIFVSSWGFLMLHGLIESGKREVTGESKSDVEM